MFNLSILKTGLIAASIGSMAFLSLGCDDDTTKKTNPLPEPQISTVTYRTADQMLLANEINESGEPFAEALGYDLDAIDPMSPGDSDPIAYTLGIENYEYSRYQLGTVISRSGIGLHMMWAPMIMKMAAMEPDEFDGSMTGGTANGYKEDDMLMKNIKMFSDQSNHMPPGNPWPQFAEFVSGDPHLPQTIDAAKFVWEDFSSLRWDRSKMDKTLNPGALGQTLMKQYLWAQDMLGAFHDADDNTIEADGTITPDLADSPDFDPNNNVFLGGDSLDGFIGMVLTAESINKVAFITGMLAYDGTELGAIDLMTYDPAVKIQYFPHSIAVTESMVMEGMPPMASGFEVTDNSSHLFDQVSLLWGTTSFTNMMNPNDTSDSAHLAYKHVFDGNPFPPSMAESGMPGPFDLMKGTSKALFQNIMAMHFDSENMVFVDVAHPTSEGVHQMPEISLVSSTYLIVSLESFIGEFTGTPLESMAFDAIKHQADFIIAHLSDGNGTYYESFTLGADAPETMSLTAQAAAIRALYVAYRVTGDNTYKSAADTAWDKLKSDYLIVDLNLFHSVPGDSSATYTPKSFAIIAGAIREATLEGNHSEGTEIYVNFFINVTKYMQLSEGSNTGETGNDIDNDGIPFIPEQPDNLPPVFAEEGTFFFTN